MLRPSYDCFLYLSTVENDDLWFLAAAENKQHTASLCANRDIYVTPFCVIGFGHSLVSESLRQRLAICLICLISPINMPKQHRTEVMILWSSLSLLFTNTHHASGINSVATYSCSRTTTSMGKCSIMHNMKPCKSIFSSLFSTDWFSGVFCSRVLPMHLKNKLIYFSLCGKTWAQHFPKTYGSRTMKWRERRETTVPLQMLYMMQQWMDANEMETGEFSLCSWVGKCLNTCSSILSTDVGMTCWHIQWLPETTGHPNDWTSMPWVWR